MKVSRDAVRRLQLERQGIGVFPRSVDKEDVFEAVDRLGCIQIDTISVVERAHHFTLWSRLGCYDKRLLYDLAYEDRRVYEGLGHAASYLPLKDWRYFIHANRVRAEDYATHRGWFADTDPGMLELVLKRIRKEGPLSSRDFEENKPQGGWWSWKPSKTALEALFSTGTLMVSYRENFQRFYDLTERVLPSWVDTSEPTKEERLRFFVTRTMGCLGAIRPSDIRGYYYDRCVKLERSVRELSAFLDGLVTEDEAVKLEVEGSKQLHYCLLEDASRLYLVAIVFSAVVFFVVLIPVYSLLDTYFGFKIPIWIETPSIIGLYGLFIKLHDKYLWKVKRLGFAIPVLPDLNGKWKSEINSSYEGGTVKEADVNIFQTYSKFSMTLKTDESSSETIMAHFSLCDPIQQKLTYCFRSDPKGVAPATMNPHNGVASLDIRDDGRQLKGFYFTGRGRMTQGDITLTKVVVTQDRNPITPPVMRTKE